MGLPWRSLVGWEAPIGTGPAYSDHAMPTPGGSMADRMASDAIKFKKFLI